MNGATEFDVVFESLTGTWPLSWQTRLYRDHFAPTAERELPRVIDLPTGLGKTMVMAVWLIAWAERNRVKQKPMPRRLIYVVDRRTVVDQATDLAQRLVARPVTKWMHDHFGGRPPTISTLRGQLADNREWSRDPSRPAIIIGTVDLIGSALLFSGYRSGFRRRPLEAGLLGQDSLLVLDEAHLSKPLEKLICEIGSEGQFQKDREGKSQGNPVHVIRMSATSSAATNSDVFRLDGDFELRSGDFADETIRIRFDAKKTLRIVSVKKVDASKIAAEALAIAGGSELTGKRIVVFVRKPEDARSVAKQISENGKTKNAPGRFANSVAVLTGTMRGLERDDLMLPPERDDQHERRVMQRFLAPVDPNPDGEHCFLVCTSAGEVGFDLNADHMVCDATTLDSLIQRVGRVNRRGNREAIVVLVVEEEPSGSTAFDKASIAAFDLLSDGMYLSPRAIAEFKAALGPEVLAAASTPKPTMVSLTDILLDAWSMTSITKKMPGRPEVGPWLRGIDDEQAQTTVAWRAEVEMFGDDPSPEKALRAIFTKHSIRPHESLTVNTGHLLEFLKRIPKLKDRPPDLAATRVAVRMSRGQVICRTLEQLIDEPGVLYADSTLILPANFGGLDKAGMLDAESIPKTSKTGDSDRHSLDVADCAGYERTDAVRSRIRVVAKKREDGIWIADQLPGGVPIPDDVKVSLKPSYPKTTTLFYDLKSARFRVRLVQPVRLNEEGKRVELLVLLGPASTVVQNEDESLSEHVGKVEQHAARIAKALGISGEVREALLFAAKWHDEGKKADIWQFFAKGPMSDGQHKGKTSEARHPSSLNRHRHELGSILRIHHPERCEKIDCTLPSDEAKRDLALHLIGTHHGAGRPHFEQANYDPFTDDERDTAHIDSIRRFARLQRKYGWWYLAWLENLLRCADQLASADDEVTEIDELEAEAS